MTVLEPLHATLDLLHIHGCIVLPDFVEDLIAAATNKVPAVREYTLKWLAKCPGASRLLIHTSSVRRSTWSHSIGNIDLKLTSDIILSVLFLKKYWR